MEQSRFEDWRRLEREAARLDAVARYRSVVRTPDDDLSELVILAAGLARSRGAILSLVEDVTCRCVAAVGVPDEDLPRLGALASRILEVGPVVETEDEHGVGVPWVTPDGLPLGALCVLEPTRQGTDVLEGLGQIARLATSLLEERHATAFWRDACDRTRHELERSWRLLDSQAEGIIGVDPAGTCTFANAQSARLLGFHSFADLLHQPLHRLLHPSCADCVLAQALRAPDDMHLESLTLWRADGTTFTSEVWTRPIWQARQRVGVVCTFLDVSPRRLLEERRREAEALKERFLGILGHDLRNPLNAIKLSVGVLGQPIGAEVRGDAIRVIGAAADRMERMIISLLDLARARLGGGIRVDRRPCDLNEICRRLVEETCAAWPEHTIDLHEAEDATGIWDPTRLEQALSNLLTNAVQHGPVGSTVTVILRSTDDTVTVGVHNWGGPIPHDELPHIFEAFHTGRRGAGAEGSLGLGLFIVREVARAHGGAVTVSSRPEAGTMFELRLPRRPGGPGSPDSSSVVK